VLLGVFYLYKDEEGGYDSQTITPTSWKCGSFPAGAEPALEQRTAVVAGLPYVDYKYSYGQVPISDA